MRHLILKSAITVAIVCLSGVTAISRPAAAAEISKGHESVEDEERRTVLEELQEWGALDKTIGAVKKEFEVSKSKPPALSPHDARQLEPETHEHHQQHQQLLDQCNSLQSPDDIEHCKEARHKAAARALGQSLGMRHIPEHPQDASPSALEKDKQKALEQLKQWGVSEKTIGVLQKELAVKHFPEQSQ